MRFRELGVEGAFAFSPRVFPDARGEFVSPFQDAAFREATGHDLFPVRQTSQSTSRRGVLRGIHYTATPPGTAKYVHCSRGEALDAVVDLRVGSPTFGAWDVTRMRGAEFTGIHLPVGVGHVFLALRDDTVMNYLWSGAYVAAHELAVDALDPALGLPWEDEVAPVVSERDRAAPSLAEARDAGLLPEYAECRRIEEEYARRAPGDEERESRTRGARGRVD